MIPLLFESYLLLLRLEFLMHFGDIRSIHTLVRQSQINNSARKAQRGAENICRAIDIACVLYGHRVLCLQRSAAATLLLRRYGFRAELLIGAQVLPFKSHAWVEIDGCVVNDRPYMPEIYQVLERC
jgi:hypothetical protein